MEGHCLCKAVVVKVHDDNLFWGTRRGHVCHCRNCRRVAGGLFGSNLAIEAEKVEIVGEENIKQYMDTDTTSGTPMARCFCGICGTPIKSVTPIMKGKIVIKLGVFPNVPQPEWEQFAERRQSWEQQFEGCVQYSRLPGKK